MVSFEATQPTLQETVNVLSVLLDEITIEFSEDAVHANGVDAAGVAMTDMTLTEDAFETYDGETTQWGADLGRLGDIIGMSESDQVISIEEGDTGKINIDSSGLEYTMALIDPSSIRNGQDIPELDFDAEFTIDADTLKRGVKACDMVSDHLEFEVNDDDEVIIAASGDTDDVRLNTAEEEDAEVEFEEDPDACSAIFSLEYLKDIIKALPSGDAVTMSVGDDFPIVISASIADEEGTITYALAPRIQSD